MKADPRFPYRAVKRNGWAREWFIVNAMGGHVDGFTGTKRQADTEAARLEKLKRESEDLKGCVQRRQVPNAT